MMRHKQFWLGTTLAVLSGLMIGATIAHLFSPSDGVRKVPSPTAHQLVVNLDKKTVSLTDGGLVIAVLPILALPKPGSPWEIAPGSYRISAREALHHSPISGHEYPFTVQLTENAFLHGEPIISTTTPVQGKTKKIVQKSAGGLRPAEVRWPSDAGGSLKLSSKDAERIFQFVTMGDRVEVSGGRSGLEQLRSALTDAGSIIEKALAQTVTSPRPKVNAHAYLVADLTSGDILLERNADETLPIASVTKLMTGRIAMTKLDQEARAKISARSISTYGTQGELRAGEELSVRELLYPTFLESSNDASEALAEIYGRDKFMAAMNDEAAALGLTQTHFVDPSGLSKQSRSSARDLFTLAQKLYQEQSPVLNLTRTKEARASGHVWRNVNKLVRAGDERYLGGKTGYIPESGLTSVSLFSFPTGEFSKKDLAIVLLRSLNRDRDITALLKAYAPEAHLVWQDSGEEEVQTTAHLLFVGDIMMSRSVAAEVHADAKGDYGYLFNFAPQLKTADVTFGNLEGPLSDKGYDLHNIYSFRMEPSSLTALTDAGFDVLSIANNHIGDWGRAAFEDTLARLRGGNIAVAGAGETEEVAREPSIIEKNGVKIGFLGFSDVGPQWLAGPASQPVVLMASNPDIKTIIENAKQQVDHLVVSFHFGEEYQKEPTARQIDFAHRAVNAGADIVIGTHPHVVEIVERYNGGVIAYSLGNFIFDQAFSKETMEGLALELTVSKDEIIDVKEHAVNLNNHFQPTID